MIDKEINIWIIANKMGWIVIYVSDIGFMTRWEGDLK